MDSIVNVLLKIFVCVCVTRIQNLQFYEALQKGVFKCLKYVKLAKFGNILIDENLSHDNHRYSLFLDGKNCWNMQEKGERN